MPSWKSKLDPYLRQLIDDVSDQDELELDIAVRVGDEEAVGGLEEAGLEVHSAVGTMVAGRVYSVDTLRTVANLPSVEEVQASHAMDAEGS